MNACIESARFRTAMVSPVWMLGMTAVSSVIKFADCVISILTNVLTLSQYSTSSSSLDLIPDAGKDGQRTADFFARQREAIARLKRHLRNLPVVQERTIPLINLTRSGKPEVKLGIVIHVLSILRVNDLHQTLKSACYISLAWQDPALAWNESQYEHVEWVNLDTDTIWTPPLFVVNSPSWTGVLDGAESLTVWSNGYVYAGSPLIVETSCPMDLYRYPLDQQVCKILLYSYSVAYNWALTNQEYSRAFASTLSVGSEWDLTKVSVEFSQKGTDPFPRLVLTLKRKTTFYTVCLLLPMVVTFYMNTLVFLLPLHSGERISFLVTVCVSTSVYVSFFSNVMPRNLVRIPYSMMLLIAVIMESFLVLLACLLVLSRFHAEEAAATNVNKNPTEDVSAEMDETLADPPTTTDKHMKTTSLHCTRNVNDKAEPNVPKQTRADDGPQRLHEEFAKTGTGIHSFKLSRSQRVTPVNCAGSQTEKKTHFPLTACQLNWIFFLITFIGNTVALAVLFVSSRF